MVKHMQTLEIFGTIGPSCYKKEIIKQLFLCGMSGMRLNLSHCNLWDKEEWLTNFHEASKECNITPSLLIDMKGPELRIKNIKEEIILHKDASIALSSKHLPKEIIENAQMSDLLLIDDGRIHLCVEDNKNETLLCKVMVEGILKDKKSIAIKDKNISGNILSENDIANLKKAKKYGVTGIMQPFVRSKEDLIYIKNILKEMNAEDLKIYAKIENMEGFHALEEIIPYSDEIIIARGDLGNATTLPTLPIIQHKIETICKKHHKPYMVVTQMLHSMQENPIPTRAEVSDIFHAVYQGAHSIMLTGESANGKYPVEAMQYFVETAKQALEYKGE